jgi:hypothetical protein
MEIFEESYIITGILCYLNYPAYLQNLKITCVEDILEKIEEKIEDLEYQIYELENYYKLIQESNDKISFFYKIKNKKISLSDLKRQFNFIKNIS